MKADADIGAQLEQAIARDPDDVRNYQVLGDWLQRRGDPHGELIALQIAAGKDPSLGRLATRRLRALLGPLAQFEAAHPGMLALRWRYGFIRGAWLFGHRTEAYRRLRAHPLARFLVALIVAPQGLFQPDEPALVELLAHDPPPLLRDLAFGDPEPSPASSDNSWHFGCDLSGIWRAMPGLRRLVTDGGSYALGDLVLPELRRAVFRCNGQGPRNAASIVHARIPRIRHLDVHGDHGTGIETLWVRNGRTTVSRCTGTFADIAPLLDRADLPELRHLGIKNCLFLDEVCRALPRSRLLRQLTELDLSVGFMNDADADVLWRHAGALRHLTSIDVSSNELSGAAIAQLQRIGPVIISGGQEPP